MKHKTSSKIIILGLGTNLGDRLYYLSSAISQLKAETYNVFTGEVVCSPVYESPALLRPDSPENWNSPFYNMVIAGASTLSPEVLLHTVKEVEVALGRKDRGRWAPREIDIDILALDKEIVQLNALEIPHKGLLERDFVYLPFADILPDWTYPLPGKYAGKSIAAIVASLPKGEAVRITSQYGNNL